MLCLLPVFAVKGIYYNLPRYLNPNHEGIRVEIKRNRDIGQRYFLRSTVFSLYPIRVIPLTMTQIPL